MSPSRSFTVTCRVCIRRPRSLELQKILRIAEKDPVTLVLADVERLHKENPEGAMPVPGELVTTSASGSAPLKKGRTPT